ncbi:hypothetical protein ACFL6E_06485 [Candidatus Neomarinimicrobiota bacterium]
MRSILIVFGLACSIAAQVTPVRISLAKSTSDSTLSFMVDSTSAAGLGSNSTLDIQAAGDSLIFFGTSGGLSVTPDLGITFRTYLAEEVDLPRGAITALNILDSTIAVSGLIDTTIAGVGELKGTGMSYSTDMGDTWTHKEQPQDATTDNGYMTYSWGDSLISQLAVTTDISNITYDLAVSNGSIWLASWSSGLRRYDIPNGTWQTIPLPRDNDITLSCTDIPAGYELNSRDPANGGSHNHKAFSVIAYDSLLWVGTAAGINKGIVDYTTGCVEWTHYNSRRDNISGNWVVALHRQIYTGGERIWASTVRADTSSEVQGVSYTEDGGISWKTELIGQRANNITSNDNEIYISTDTGLFKSLDSRNWARFNAAVDELTGEEVWAEEVHGSLYDSRDSTLWLATPDGLAATSDLGVAWEVIRAFVSTRSAGEERFYAYPNPFYLNRNNLRDGVGHVRFQYHIIDAEQGLTAAVEIFDFAMNRVAKLTSRVHELSGDFSQVWDGRNSAGHEVANGVYYCNLKIGNSAYWTKVMVIK